MQRPESQRQLALALIWLTPALWTVNYLVARSAPGVIEPYALASGRWLLAGGILALIARQELWRERHAVLAVWYQYIVLGTLGMMICGAWVYIGAQTTQAANIALIYAAAPVFIALGSVIWLRERMGSVQLAGVVVALAGVVHVVVKGRWTALSGVQWVVGDLWIIAATFSWAAYALLQKIWASNLSATARLACICAGGVLVMLPFTIWEAGLPTTPAWTWRALAMTVTVGLLPGVGAYWIYGWAQKILGASRVAMTLYLGPLYGAVAAYLVLNEPLGWHHLVGAALILPGVFMVTRTAASEVAPKDLKDPKVSHRELD